MSRSDAFLAALHDELHSETQGLGVEPRELRRVVAELGHIQDEVRWRASELPHGLWLADATGRILSFSPSFAALLGLEPPGPDNPTGPGWSAGPDPEARCQTAIQVQRYMARGLPWTLETCRATPSGRACVRSRGVPLRAADGQLYWAGLSLLAPDRRRNSSETHSRHVPHGGQMPDMIVRFDRSLRICYINQAALGHVNREQSQVLGGTLGEVGLRPSLAELVEGRLQQVFASGAEAVFTVPWRNRRRLDMHVRAIPEGEPGGEVSSVLLIARDVSELERARRQLAESERSFRTLAENIPDIIVRFDLKGRYQYVNKRAAEQIGKSPEEVLGKRQDEVGLPDDLALLKIQRLEQVIREGREVSFETCSMFGDEQITHHVRMVPELDEHGRVQTVLGAVRDVTAFRRTEAELAKRERLYRVLVERSPDVVLRFDSEFRHTYINSKAVDLAGMQPSEVLGKTLAECGFDPGYVATCEAVFRKALETRREQAFEADLPLAHRCVRLHLRVVPEVGEDGPEGLLAVARDISDLQTAREELAASEAHYRTLVEHTPDLVTRVDAADRITFMNTATLGLVGRKREDVLGRDFFELSEELGYPPETIRLFRRNLERVRRIGGPLSDEVAVPMLGGERIFQYRLVLEREPGVASSVLVISHDISELVNTRSDLARAKERAEAENRAKSQFLALMSHELRTPVSGILGVTDLLLQKLSGRTKLAMVDLLRESALSLNAIVSDILDLAQIEAGRFQIEPCDCRLSAELDKLIGLYRPAAEKKGLYLRVETRTGAPEHLRCDPDRLGQVLRNLVSNAIKFTHHGGVEVLVEPAPASEGEVVPGDKPALRFVVRDTGIGIPENRMADLFQEYSRLESYLTRKSEGTGLGLAISRKLVELMGGVITVRSKEGQGSEFGFVLPYEPAHEERRATSKVQAAGLADLPPMTLVLAEDNRVNQMFMTEFLKDAGHTVIIAENGQQALDIVMSQECDCVLMDVQMPGMDGLTATQHIRESQAACRGVPIIALTAFAGQQDAQRFLESGMDGYVTKPVDFGFLAEEIRRVVLSR